MALSLRQITEFSQKLGVGAGKNKRGEPAAKPQANVAAKRAAASSAGRPLILRRAPGAAPARDRDRRDRADPRHRAVADRPTAPEPKSRRAAPFQPNRRP